MVFFDDFAELASTSLQTPFAPHPLQRKNIEHAMPVHAVQCLCGLQ